MRFREEILAIKEKEGVIKEAGSISKHRKPLPPAITVILILLILLTTFLSLKAFSHPHKKILTEEEKASQRTSPSRATASQEVMRTLKSSHPLSLTDTIKLLEDAPPELKDDLARKIKPIKLSGNLDDNDKRYEGLYTALNATRDNPEAQTILLEKTDPRYIYEVTEFDIPDRLLGRHFLKTLRNNKDAQKIYLRKALNKESRKKYNDYPGPMWAVIADSYNMGMIEPGLRNYTADLFKNNRQEFLFATAKTRKEKLEVLNSMIKNRQYFNTQAKNDEILRYVDKKDKEVKKKFLSRIKRDKKSLYSLKLATNRHIPFLPINEKKAIIRDLKKNNEKINSSYLDQYLELTEKDKDMQETIIELSTPLTKPEVLASSLKSTYGKPELQKELLRKSGRVSFGIKKPLDPDSWKKYKYIKGADLADPARKALTYSSSPEVTKAIASRIHYIYATFDKDAVIKVYSDTGFLEETKGLEPAARWDIAVTLTRKLKRENKKLTTKNIREASKQIIKQREEFAGKNLVDKETTVINILNDGKEYNYKGDEDYSFDIDGLLKLYKKAGAKKVTKIIGNKHDALKEIKNSRGKTLIAIDAHGNRVDVWLGGADTIELAELGNALLKRGDLKEVSITIDSCFSYNFATNLYNYINQKRTVDTAYANTKSSKDKETLGRMRKQLKEGRVINNFEAQISGLSRDTRKILSEKLKDKETDFPTIITASNRDSYARMWGSITAQLVKEGVYLVLDRGILKAKKGKKGPLTGRDILNAEKYIQSIEDIAVFMPSKEGIKVMGTATPQNTLPRNILEIAEGNKNNEGGESYG